MKVALSWLKDYVEINCSPEQLKEKLFYCGFEVEEAYEIGKDISGVVVGEVVECQGIEGTHLHVCKVDCGKHGILQICCGADNVKVGIKAPCALVGATVYATGKDHITIEGVMTIKKGKLRGVESFGMLCAGVEIGVNGDFFEGGDYNGLLILPNEWENGSDVKKLLGLDDYIFDIAITANRPDCQSVIGIAREISAVLKTPFTLPDLSYSVTQTSDAPFDVSIEADDLCHRYIAHYVKDVKIAPSPLWMRKRLALSGLRSINNVVDITNFILLEWGQPMHAFDLNSLTGRKINVRRAKNDEEIITLDNKTFKLNSENLVICDGDKPCALAGIMGGLNSEIKDETCEVLFESAKFVRDSIRKTSRALGQHSDSSFAFEKGVNEYTTEKALDRALHLIEELNCGVITHIHSDVVTKNSKTTSKKLEVSISKINALLGIVVPTETMIDILVRLNFDVKNDGDILYITIPRYREDIDNYPDIAEEIIRQYGYSHIKSSFMPTATVTNGGYNALQRLEKRIKNIFVSCGHYEISTYSFYSEKSLDLIKLDANATERNFIKILNPIGEDLSVMRTILVPSMISTVVRNIRRNNMDGKLFEIAKIYLPTGEDKFPIEKKMICSSCFGGYDFFDLKGSIEYLAKSLNTKFDYKVASYPFLHKGISADILCNGKKIGFIGELDPTICDELSIDKKIIVSEISFDDLVECANAFKFKPIPKFAEVKRDLALICDKELTCEEIEKAIYASSKLVSNVYLFDVYTGSQILSSKKSMAFSITLTPNDVALTPEDADNQIKRILKYLERNLGITLR